MDETIEQVETFIQRLQDLTYVVSPEASKIMYEKSGALTPLKSAWDVSNDSLADYLADSISTYLHFKGMDRAVDIEHAKKCLAWIQRAFASGVIREGQGLLNRLEECKTERNQLEEKLSTLSASYLALEQEKQKLELELEEFKKRVGLKSKSEWEKREK